MATTYNINYNDERFTSVESDKKQALSEVNKTYDSMINQSDQYYQAQIDASKAWAEEQKQLQQEQTDFAIEQIEQQKDQAKQDYTKEQSGAYVDWQKQSGQYGVNAEAMAAQGMGGTGYSESAQVSMYNTYQNRVATARESYNRAVLNYDNAIKDARLQNNAALAEIAYTALQTQLELALEGFQYKNSLILAKSDKKTEVDDRYYGRYQDVLKQINTENAMAEEVRQYNESLAEEKRQYDKSYSLQAAELQLAKDKFDYEKEQDAAAKEVYTSDKAGGGGGNSSARGASNPNYSSNRSKTTNSTSSSKSSGSGSSGGGGGGTRSSSPTIDMNSVLALGYGPISEARLSQLVDQGLVEQYVSGNKIKFRKSAYTNKQSMLLR